VVSTILDLETNAAYTRQRVAEIRAMSRDAHDTPVILRSRPSVLAPLRIKLGAALIAIGERLSGVSMPRRATPSSGRVSSY
jgi:hypothetical protein